MVGLMPHPERACERVLGSADGLVLFESVVAALAARQGASERREHVRARDINDARSIPRFSNVTV